MSADDVPWPITAIRVATLDDAEAISRFAARVFDETFASTATPEEMSGYINAAYATDIQAAEIADPRAILFVAEDISVSGTPLAGYAHIILEPDTSSIELKRIYVDACWQGRGVAGRLLEEVLAERRRRHLKRLWLAVWHRNTRAIAFYKKSGFEHSGSMAFDWGDGEEAGLIMEFASLRVLGEKS